VHLRHGLARGARAALPPRLRPASGARAVRRGVHCLSRGAPGRCLRGREPCATKSCPACAGRPSHRVKAGLDEEAQLRRGAQSIQRVAPGAALGTHWAPRRAHGAQVFTTRQVAEWQLEVASGRQCVICRVVEEGGAGGGAAPPAAPAPRAIPAAPVENILPPRAFSGAAVSASASGTLPPQAALASLAEGSGEGSGGADAAPRRPPGAQAPAPGRPEGGGARAGAAGGTPQASHDPAAGGARAAPALARTEGSHVSSGGARAAGDVGAAGEPPGPEAPAATAAA